MHKVNLYAIYIKMCQCPDKLEIWGLDDLVFSPEGRKN